MKNTITLHTEENVQLLPSQRNLSREHAREIDLAKEAGLEPTEVFNLMSTYVGGQENLGYTILQITT